MSENILMLGEDGLISKTSMTAYCDLKYMNGELTALENSLLKMTIDLSTMNNFNLSIAKVKVQENFIRNSNLLSNSEKTKLSLAASIARYSRKYWEFDARSESWATSASNDKWMVVAADLMTIAIAFEYWDNQLFDGSPGSVDAAIDAATLNGAVQSMITGLILGI